MQVPWMKPPKRQEMVREKQEVDAAAEAGAELRDEVGVRMWDSEAVSRSEQIHRSEADGRDSEEIHRSEAVSRSEVDDRDSEVDGRDSEADDRSGADDRSESDDRGETDDRSEAGDEVNHSVA